MPKSKYRFDTARFYKDAPNSTWSVTKIDRLGNAKCFGHFTTSGAAVEKMDLITEGLSDWERNNFSTRHHYGACIHCEVTA